MRIAVVGSGISGLVCAHLLNRRHEVHLFEAASELGGHTHTVEVEHDGQRFAIDTGFIVYNETNYPNFTQLLRQLGVATQDTEMSFSVSSESEDIEYNGASLSTLFAQRRNLCRPRFWRMLRDILRFYRSAPRLLAEPDEDLTLIEYLMRKRYSREFIDWHILPMGAAIWSTDRTGTGEFPLMTFLRFFERHGFLRVSGRPQWKTIVGGSSSYVRAMAPHLGFVHRNSTVRAIHRRPGGIEVTAEGGSPQRFDAVVLATHSDQALRALADPSPSEREILRAIDYQANRVVLHTDARLMPRTRRAWASWNYHLLESDRGVPTVTYNMNILQRLEAPVQFCVTLNREEAIDPDQIIGTYDVQHPRFDRAAVAARARHPEINGIRNTYFCGAYWGDGFHEDGVNSALAVCKLLGEGLAP